MMTRQTAPGSQLQVREPGASSRFDFNLELDYVERNNLSLNVFKQYLKNFFDISSYSKYFDYSIDRYSSILHTRLRLNCCTLNYYLFKIDCM